MRAIVVGATGAVGSSLVRELLASPAFGQVTALTRRAVTSFDAAPGKGKLRIEVVDLAGLERDAARLGAGFDAAFNCMGIGQPRKVSYEEFRRVDVEYAGAFARGAKAAGVRHISLLSAIGTNIDSSNRYIRTKGQAEQAVIDASIARTSLFRPSLLVTKDIRYGLQDRLTQTIFPVVSPLLPRKYHQVTVEDLGRAMCLNAERPGTGVEFLEYPQFRALLDAGRAGSR